MTRILTSQPARTTLYLGPLPLPKQRTQEKKKRAEKGQVALAAGKGGWFNAGTTRAAAINGVQGAEQEPEAEHDPRRRKTV